MAVRMFGLLLALAAVAVTPSATAASGRKATAKVERQRCEREALVAAIVDHESGGNPRAINPASDARGLGQILPSTRPQCRPCSSAAPCLGEPRPQSAACASEKERLLEPEYNRRLIRVYLQNQEVTCRTKTGRTASSAGLIMSYGGWNRPKASRGLPVRWCSLERRRGRWVESKVPKAVRDIMVAYKRGRAKCSSAATPRSAGKRSKKPSSAAPKKRRAKKGKISAATFTCEASSFFTAPTDARSASTMLSW